MKIGEKHKRNDLSKKPEKTVQDSTSKLIDEIKNLNVNEFTAKDMGKAHSKLIFHFSFFEQTLTISFVISLKDINKLKNISYK